MSTCYDGAVGLTTEADSSGLVPTSSPSPSGSSDSSSASPLGTCLGFGALSGYLGPQNPSSLMTTARNHKSHYTVPHIPNRAEQHRTDENVSRRTSTIFLNQFQEQMSQMKEAMDAVQKEILSSPTKSRSHHHHGNNNNNNLTYQSQIAATNGLVIKIRKAETIQKSTRHSVPDIHTPTVGQVRFHRKPGRKKRRRVDEDVIYCGDSEDEEAETHATQKKRKSNGITGAVKTAVQDSTISEGSGWGNALPVHLLRRILGQVVESEGAIPFLVRASRVCRLWNEAALDSTLWTSVDLSTGKVKDKYRSERNLIYFLENKFSCVKHLSLGGWSSAVTSTAVDVLTEVCPHLETLNLSTCNRLSAQNVKSIAESLTRLSKLDLSAVSAAYNAKSAVSPSGIGEAAEVFGSRLLQLSLASNCLGNLPQVLASLAEHCKNLQVLDLSNINSPRRDTILIRIEELQIGCPSLRVLRLTNSDIVLGELSIKDQVNSPGFEKLEELSIATDPKRSQGLDDNDLERIAKNSHRLRLLDARGCTRISDSGLVRLPAWDLEHLYLSGSSATKSSRDGLELICQKWRHSFKDIDVSWTPSEDSLALAMKTLAEGPTPALRSLDLSGSSVTFASVQLLLQTAINLQALNLASCRALPRGLKRNYQTPVEVHYLREQVLKLQDTTLENGLE